MTAADVAPRILVVDDEESVREFTERALQTAGYEVVAESNGRILRPTLQREAGAVGARSLRRKARSFTAIFGTRTKPGADAERQLSGLSSGCAPPGSGYLSTLSIIDTI
jgi:DNA-binding NarL/FixJ family response regulator